MPPWPIAMPSSTAIVLNSRGIAPAARTASAMTRPTSARWTWPGTNSVKLLATAIIGLPKSSEATPVARSRARAPAMFRPCVTVRDLNGGIAELPHHKDMGSSAYRRDRPRRRDVRQHPRRRVIDRANLLAGELRRALALPGASPEVLAQRGPAEHVDVPDRRDVPRDPRPVDGERRPDRDLGPERGREDLAGLARLPRGVLQPLLLRLGTTIEPLAVQGADRDLGVPFLRVDRVDAGRADDKVVDELPAVGNGPGVEGEVPVAPHPLQLPAGAPLGAGLARPVLVVGRVPRPVHGVDDPGQNGQREADHPVLGQNSEQQPDDDHDDRAGPPEPNLHIRGKIANAYPGLAVAGGRGGPLAAHPSPERTRLTLRRRIDWPDGRRHRPVPRPA